MIVFPSWPRHLADRTGPIPIVKRPARHYVTSETPQHYTARRLIAKHATTRKSSHDRPLP